MSVTIPCDAKLDKSKRVDRPTGSANWLKNLARGGDIPYPLPPRLVLRRSAVPTKAPHRSKGESNDFVNGSTAYYNVIPGKNHKRNHSPPNH